MKIDPILAILILFLSFLGLINFFSASYLFSLKNFDNPYLYFLRFLTRITFGGLIFFFLGNILAQNINRYRKIIIFFFIIFYLSIFIGFLPQFRLEGASAYRWVSIGPLSFQPSEIIKPLAILVFAFLFSSLRKFSLILKIIIFVFSSLILLLPIYFQPSLSNVMIIFGSIVVVFATFLKSTRELFFITLVVLILGLILILASTSWGYRKERFISFVTKGKVFEEKYFQVEQSILAISSGGLTGRGLGKSEIKIIGLPQMLTDSIFAIYAEEWGFIWSLILIFLLFLLISRIILLGAKSEDQIKKSFSFAVALWLSAQTFLHIASNTGIFVPTGVILPFFSYGASGQLAIYFSLGFISRNG